MILTTTQRKLTYGFCDHTVVYGDVILCTRTTTAEFNVDISNTSGDVSVAQGKRVLHEMSESEYVNKHKFIR